MITIFEYNYGRGVAVNLSERIILDISYYIGCHLSQILLVLCLIHMAGLICFHCSGITPALTTLGTQGRA